MGGLVMAGSVGPLLWTLLLWGALPLVAAPTTYYVDRAGGNDGAAGTSPSSAWKGLAKVNGATFGPGDKIFLKAGSVWSGSLSPQGSGAEGNPIVIDTFGTGARPIVNGNGAVGATFVLRNQQYWEINNLELTNDDDLDVEDKTARRSGIRISASSGVMHHIHVKNCYIHDVDGSSLHSKSTGGIIMPISDGASFDGILLEGNTIRKVDRTGICATPGGLAVTRNMVIRNNTIINTGGDGMIVQGSHKPLIEHNLADGCCARCLSMCNAGIWPWASDSSLFQFNEARNTVGGGCDRQGFDCDWKCNGTVFQYNYSHENGGGFMLICTYGDGPERYNNGSVVRYNISQNDRTMIFDLSGPGTRETQIYNNTIYVDESAGTKKIISDTDWGGLCGTAHIRNNIFYVLTHDATFGVNPNYTFDNNCYYMPNSRRPDPKRHTNALFADPMFADPGTSGNGLSAPGGYKLKPTSPCINRGKDLRTLGIDPGTRDYFDNPIPQAKVYDIGAHEYTGSFKPVGFIASPAHLERIVPSPATIPIAVEAWHPGGEPIKAVAFYDGKKRLGKDVDPSDGWGYAWRNVGKGNHTLTARIMGRRRQYSLTPAVEVIVGYRDPVNVVNAEQGLEYKYYEAVSDSTGPGWVSIPDLSALTPVKTGICDGFSLSVRDRLEQIGIRYTGYLDVPADGVYTVWVLSNDGGNLYIGDSLVVANDGVRGSFEGVWADIALGAGKHPITLDYYNSESVLGLLLKWECVSAGVPSQIIPHTRLHRGGEVVR